MRKMTKITRKIFGEGLLRTVILFGVPFMFFTVATVLFSFRFLWSGTDENQMQWRLETPFSYDDVAKEKIIEAQTDGLCCVFWKKNRNITVENQEFSRSERMNVYGIAGNPAALFSGANVLWPGEEGYCLLSADAAHKLFGSTDVVGKSVKIGEKSYEIAGVQYEKENLCVYQLSPEEGQKVNFAACWYGTEDEKYMVKKRITTLFSC